MVANSPAQSKSDFGITHAVIEWRADSQGLQVPYSPVFDDVYFSQKNGLAESQHVFLAGNQLEQRLCKLNQYRTFIIGELGFGTGLNVLATWQLWYRLRQNNPNLEHAKLHIITTEKHPLLKSDLEKALACWHDLTPFAKQLIDNYPPLIEGCHRLNFFEDNLSIDLWLGDAAQSLARAQTNLPVNAWFLDGFTPSSNESLWADDVLNQIQRLSWQGSTAATFSVAGVIKRGLSDRGFSIAKTLGFGNKREMLTANIPEPDNDNLVTSKAVSDDKTQKNAQKHIAVIGAGVAGLCTAFCFASRGHKVTIVDKQKPLAGGSGNPRALLAPKLTPIHHVNKHLHTISFLYAVRFYESIGNMFAQRIYDKTGVLDLLTQSNVTPVQIEQYPSTFSKMQNAGLASEQAEIDLKDCMYMPEAGLVDTSTLAKTIMQHKNISFVKGDITSVQSTDSGVTITSIVTDEHSFENGVELNADTAILCTAQHSADIHKLLPKPRTTRGQVSWFELDDSLKDIPLPKIPLKYGGYCASFNRTDINGDSNTTFLLGATFVRNTTDAAVCAIEHEQNLEKLTEALPQLNSLSVENSWQGRVSFRAQMPDYLPLIGKVDKHIYTMSALGSKGFSYAPLCADMLANMVFGEPMPLPQGLVKKLNPLRFN